MKRMLLDQADESSLSLRKAPKQERARSLVDSILEATVRILASDPERAPSTREIAEKAGVSVGSLYEYFPGREAILAKLVELDLERNRKRIEEFVATLEGRTPSAKIEALVDFGVDQFLSGGEFKRGLFQRVVLLRKVREVLDAWNGIAELLAAVMREHRDEILIPEERIDRAAYVLSNAIQGLLQTQLLPGNRRFPVEELKLELVQLCVSYLLPPPRSN